MPSEHPGPRLLYPLLAVGVVAVSFSAIFIRLAHAPSLAIAFYRNLFASALLLPVAFALKRDELRRLERRDLAVAALSGAFLALHFATWIPSVRFTTVAASTVLVTTQSVWVAAAGARTGERISRAAGIGIAVALAGALVISGGDFGVSGRAVWGDVLALAGAIFGTGYFLIGRNLRRRVSLLAYVAVVYPTCTAGLGLAMLASGTPFAGFPPKTWLLFLAMAIVPQILGHTVFNFLLRHLTATEVVVAIMGEPIGASLLALAFFSEVPRWTVVVGGVLTLAGIYVAVASQARRAAGSVLEEAPIE